MNPQNLLGSLLMGALGGRSLRRDPRVALGLGAVALAAAAWKHYSDQREAAQQATTAPGTGALPPPPPPAAPALPEDAPAHRDAVLLVRAMIAAASADGVIDAAERQTIMERVGAAGLGDEERAYLTQQLATPPSIEEIVVGVASPRLAEEVYAVSLLAMRPDTDSERTYLAQLASRLALPAEAVERIEQVFGVGPAQP